MPTVPNRVKLPTEKDCMWKPVVGLIVNVALPPMANTCWPETLIARLASAIASVSVPSGARVMPSVPLRSTTPATSTWAPLTVSWKVFGLTPSSVDEVVLIWNMTLPTTFSPSRPTSWRVPLAFSAYWPAVGLAPGASMNDRVAPLDEHADRARVDAPVAVLVRSAADEQLQPGAAEAAGREREVAVDLDQVVEVDVDILGDERDVRRGQHRDIDGDHCSVDRDGLVDGRAGGIDLQATLALSDSPLPAAEIVPSRTPAKPLPVMISAPRAFEMEPNVDEPL